jgi:hypothetical protein
MRMARYHFLLAAVLVVGACGESSFAPQPDPPRSEPTAGAVAVGSPIGRLMAVGRNVRLTADVTDVNGQPVGASPTWSSSDTAVATVDNSGLVTAMAPGGVMVTATVVDVEGEIDLTAVSADLEAIASLVGDPFVSALVSAIPSAPGADVDGALDTCLGHVDTGDLASLGTCVDDARGAVTDANDVTGAPLRALLSLTLDAVERLLALP